MQNPWMLLREEISKEVLAITKTDVTNLIEEPMTTGQGDLALPCFLLAKKFQVPPQEVSEDLAERLKIKYFKEIKAIGPYLNFYIDWTILANEILKSIKKDYGKNEIGKGKRVMVEFCNANTNKPLHIGHARNIVIGDSLSNILKKSGYTTIKANYFGDIGMHIAKSIYAYEKWGKDSKPNMKSDHFVGNFYTMFVKKAEDDFILDDKARDVLKLWENKDKKILEIWKKMTLWSVKGMEETIKRYGIKFDATMSESQFEETGKEYTMKLLERGYAFKGDDGQIVADLEKYGISNCVILRSDGTSLYQTKELALTEAKFKKYRLDQSINVVGMEQDMYFKQVFKMLELLQSRITNKSHHLSYGLVMTPEGKMSGRKGVAVSLDDLMDDVKNNIHEMIKKKFNKKDANTISEKVAIGAIKYALIKISPERSIMFNKKEIIRYEGNTGPYLQYTYTRAGSILKKAKIKTTKFDASKLTLPEELALLRILAQYPMVIEKAAKELRPHYLADYLFNLADSFNKFYEKVPVIKAEKDVKVARIKLVEAVRFVLASGLNNLGMPVLEKM